MYLSMNRKIFSITIGIFLILFFLSLSSLDAAVIDNGNGSVSVNDSSTISDGLNSLTTNYQGNGTIYLNEGNYSGSGNVNQTISNRNITIIGNGSSGKTVIDGSFTNWLFRVTNGQITLINLKIANSFTGLSVYPGIIFISDGTITISDCDLINNINSNTASHTGGVIFADNSTVNVINSNFINNSAIRGSGITVENSTTFIMNSKFVNNHDSFTGGAFYASGNRSSVTINNCDFIGNNATSGGSIYLAQIGGQDNSNTFALINNSRFINNIGTNYGAIFTGFKTYIVNSIFTNNSATVNAGALFTQYYCNVTNSTFENNKANNGGAIYSSGALFLMNSNFTNNSVNGIGGAIYKVIDYISVDGCYFINNSANRGAGIGISSIVTLDVNNSVFNNNQAVDLGGAIFTNNGNFNSTISNSKFNNNSASYGGAIYNNGRMLLNNNLMFGNSATVLGNVIFNNYTIGILNLTFIGNKTVYPSSKDNVILNATLIDDMGNPITGQIITFIIDGNTYSAMVVEGKASIMYNFSSKGEYVLTGFYNGSGIYPINIYNGLIIFVGNLTSDLSLDKNKVKVNETVKGSVNISNIGNWKEEDVILVLTLPNDFILDIIPTNAVYDSQKNTLTWFIGDLNPGDSLSFDFIGKFINSGNYTFYSSVFNDNVSINNSALIEVIKEDNNNTNNTNNTNDTNNTDINNTNNTNINQVYSGMKATGIPIIGLILIILSITGIGVYRKK